jgi:hypothetical protein
LEKYAKLASVKNPTSISWQKIARTDEDARNAETTAPIVANTNRIVSTYGILATNPKATKKITNAANAPAANRYGSHHGYFRRLFGFTVSLDNSKFIRTSVGYPREGKGVRSTYGVLFLIVLQAFFFGQTLPPRTGGD